MGTARKRMFSVYDSFLSKARKNPFPVPLSISDEEHYNKLLTCLTDLPYEERLLLKDLQNVPKKQITRLKNDGLKIGNDK